MDNKVVPKCNLYPFKVHPWTDNKVVPTCNLYPFKVHPWMDKKSYTNMPYFFINKLNYHILKICLQIVIKGIFSLLSCICSSGLILRHIRYTKCVIVYKNSKLFLELVIHLHLYDKNVLFLNKIYK